VTDPRHRAAFLDWLACAVGGRGERAAVAAARAGDPVLAAAAAGHVLDFDDTYLPGLAHLSAPTAPAALLVAAEAGRPIGAMLEAYAAGFEAMAAMARASHPALYQGALHPTAVCGGVGAAVAAARLLGLGPEERESAVAISLLQAAGLRSAFGSDGKALQVGMAAAGGARAARLAAAGARVPLPAAAKGFAEATGGSYAEPAPGVPAVALNWIKPWPCCLQSHGAIEAALAAGGRTPAVVRVHPVSVRAAAVGPEPRSGLEAKFSIPYLTALTLLRGPPGVSSFEAVDAEASALAAGIEVSTDADLLESEAVLEAGDGAEIARVEAARGSPGRPLASWALRAKLVELGGPDLPGALDDPSAPASGLLARLAAA
jgi:2-methylcitrate dehydratase PrpD